MENKRFIIDTKLLPYFGKQKICDIDTIKVRKWQNELISYRDDDGKPFSQTYLKTVNNQLSAIMNYAVSHYRLPVNPCRAAGSMGKSKADEMNIWTQKEYERFSNAISKSSMKLAFDILFYTGMRSGELLALTPADILSSKRIDINKNYAKIKGEELFLEPKTPKAKRCISIPDFLYDDIQEYISKLCIKGNPSFHKCRKIINFYIYRIYPVFISWHPSSPHFAYNTSLSISSNAFFSNT